MSDLLNKQICLALNKNWMGFDFRTVRKGVEAITSLSPETGEPPFMFLDLVYAQNEDGSYDTTQLVSARPVTVDEWLGLEVRSCDLAINCGRCQLRAPTIIVATNYADLPEFRPKFSSEGVWERDKGVCQATGRKLTREEGDLGHNVARANGGRRTWENIALLDKRLNRLQETKTFAEMGWNIKPKAPKSRKVLLTMKDAEHESHLHFLN